MAREVWRSPQSPSTCKGPGAPLGMLDSAINHWKSCGGELPRAMETISSGENILETIFSFQPEQVEVFVNTDGASPEDISLRLCPDDGGFELNVLLAQGEPLKNCVRREVRRLYSFQRPLRWEMARASLTGEGVLHLVVPGPPMMQPIIEPCF